MGAPVLRERRPGAAAVRREAGVVRGDVDDHRLTGGRTIGLDHFGELAAEPGEALPVAARAVGGNHGCVPTGDDVAADGLHARAERGGRPSVAVATGAGVVPDAASELVGAAGSSNATTSPGRPVASIVMVAMTTAPSRSPKHVTTCGSAGTGT